jgi:hypothetical protein
MEHHIAHLYELRNFLVSLKAAARQSPDQSFPVQVVRKTDPYIPERSRTLLDPGLLDAAERLGVSLPPLAVPRQG